MASEELDRHHDMAREAWNKNAVYWDERMGEGNDFVNILIWPILERMLNLREGHKVLDIACGNGLTSRRLAAAGAEVVAFDFSERLIEIAQGRTVDHQRRIEYMVLDATEEEQLFTLGEDRFDSAICNMALFDMAKVEPLFRSLTRLLGPEGRFVFSTLHPCFNSSDVVRMAEEEDRDGEMRLRYAVKVYHYLSPFVHLGAALRGQPEPQPYFHRPLGALLEPAFEAGFVLDALQERAFPPDHSPGENPLGWSGKFSEIPPVLIARLRLPA